MENNSVNETAEYDFAGDDVVVPFAVEPLDVRGRAVQVGPMLDTLLNRHEYPQDICFLMGELIVLSVLLGTSLKFDGNFILQTQSDGPVSMTVVDFSTPGSVRAYARFDEAGLEEAVKQGKTSPRELLGEGVMAMTIDQGPHTQRYQGVVALDGATLEEVAHQYFKQSEQIPTRVRLTVAQILRRDGEGGELETKWRAGGILTQFLPEASSRVVAGDLPDGREDEGEMQVNEDDAWVEASTLMNTIGDDELSDPQITVERLLYRLFNEHGVRVFEGVPIEEQCSCSREKVIAMVKNFEDDANATEKSEGFQTKCEFCGTKYDISATEL